MQVQCSTASLSELTAGINRLLYGTGTVQYCKLKRTYSGYKQATVRHRHRHSTASLSELTVGINRLLYGAGIVQRCKLKRTYSRYNREEKKKRALRAAKYQTKKRARP